MFVIFISWPFLFWIRYLLFEFESKTLLIITKSSAEYIINASLNSFVLKIVLLINIVPFSADSIPSHSELLLGNNAVLFSNKLLLMMRFPFSFFMNPLNVSCDDEEYCILLLVTVMLFKITVSRGLLLYNTGVTSGYLPNWFVGFIWLLSNAVFSIYNVAALSINPLIFKSCKFVYWFEVISKVESIKLLFLMVKFPVLYMSLKTPFPAVWMLLCDVKLTMLSFNSPWLLSIVESPLKVFIILMLFKVSLPFDLMLNIVEIPFPSMVKLLPFIVTSLSIFIPFLRLESYLDMYV